MFDALAKDYSFDMREFLQNHLDISSTENLPLQNSILDEGTWIGVLTKNKKLECVYLRLGAV